MTINTFKRPLFLEDQATRLKPEITALLDKGAARLQAGEDVEETIGMVVDGLKKMRHPDARAQELTGLLFSLLNPGGRLLFTNFLPSLGDAGYMEAYMDWWPTYRTKAQLLQLAAALPDEQIEFIHCFTEGNGYVAFVEIGRVS
jgi:hypothetical protein